MTTEILSFFVIGFTAAALPGVVQTTVFQAGLKGKPKDAMSLAMGAATMDGTLLLLASLGITRVLIDVPGVFMVLGLVGVCFLIYLSVSGIKEVWFSRTEQPVVKRRGYISGILLVALQPPTLLYYISVASGIFQGCEYGVWTYVLSAFAVSVGAICCFLLVFFLASFTSSFRSGVLIKFFSTLASVLLFGFSIKLLLAIL